MLSLKINAISFILNICSYFPDENPVYIYILEGVGISIICGDPQEFNIFPALRTEITHLQNLSLILPLRRWYDLYRNFFKKIYRLDTAI